MKRSAKAKPSTRDQFIAATSELMIENDAVEVSLSEIAARARSNVALVKYYFGNKQGLLIALLERDVAGATETLSKLMQSELSATEKMQLHIGGMLRSYHRFPYLNRLIRHITRDVDPETGRELTQRVLSPIVDFYKSVIAQGVESGEFRYVDPMLFYFTTVGACDQLFSARGVLKAVFKVDNVDDELQRRYELHTISMLTQGLASQ